MDLEKLKELNMLANQLIEMQEDIERVSNAITLKLVVGGFSSDCYISSHAFHTIYNKYLPLIIKDMNEIYEEKKREFEAM